MRVPIRARLTLWYALLLALILVAVGAFLLVRLRADLVGGVDDSLDTRAAQISLGLENGCEGEFKDVSDASLRGLPQGESGAQLLGPDGSVMESTGDAITARPLLTLPELHQVLGGERQRMTIVPGPEGESFRTLAVALPSNGCPGALVVATSLDEVNHSVERLLVLMAVGIPVAVAAAAAGGWWLAGVALRPVSRMTAEASAIGPDRLDERIDVPRTSDEIQRLASTLNSMLDRVRTGVEEKRRFVADASHELRTPLAIMRSELDVSLRNPNLARSAREVLTSSVEEVDRMSGVVENLLTLARMDRRCRPARPSPDRSPAGRELRRRLDACFVALCAYRSRAFRRAGGRAGRPGAGRAGPDEPREQCHPLLGGGRSGRGADLAQRT